ncbi:MAG: hypothetical protein LBD79_09230 [Treponema sp.]|jgi:hypothetical protein|nr:hypothetical protein [Treponema sp.]
MTKNPNETTEEKILSVSSEIPVAAIIALEQDLAGMVHGTVTLTLHIRDGRLARFITGRERSFMGETGNSE